GWTLADTIDRAALGPEAVRTLGLQVLDALAAAHQMGLIHRDIKPTNLLGAGPDRWKVGDFGIAKSVEATDPGLTSTGMVIGTPAYLAPERRAGAPATRSTDLYAVAVVLLEAAIGRRGGPGDASPDGLRRRLAQVEPPARRSLLERATSDDPARRHDSADAMADELRAWDPDAASYGVTAVQGAVGDTVLDAGPERPPSAATRVLGATEKFPSSPEPPSRLHLISGHALLRSRPLQAVAAVIVVALIITVVVLAGHGGSTPPRTSPPPTVATPSSLPPGLDAALRRLQQAVKP
ncbi:MAG: serine/threonine-protein kinase, partial [Acidimicrobiales bacterium]